MMQGKSGEKEQIAQLFPMSPMIGAKSFVSGNQDEPSLAADDKQEEGSAMSIDSSNTSTTQRAPFGEVQNKPAAAYREPSVFKTQSNFEFKVQPQQPVQASRFAVNPFAAVPKLQPAAANDSARMADQVMPSPEPATPASITSESRGGPAAPPVATYASISKGASPTDSGTVTPLVNMHASHVPLSTYTGSPDLAAAVAASKRPSKVNYGDILLWKEPLQTATIFIAGLAGFALLNFAAYGAHNMTLMSAVSYLLILDLFFNFFRYFVSKSWHEQCLWGGAAQVRLYQMRHFLTTINAQVLRLAGAHDRYLSAVDPFITLKVAGALWASAWVGAFLSLWWAVVLAYLGAFTVPVTYRAFKPTLELVGRKIKAQTIDRIDAAGLPRTVRFLFCVAGIAALYMTTSFTQTAIGFFVACTYWRTLLAPREIDAVRAVAEPYTASAFKVGRRISTAASDVFDRMSTAGPKSRTKSHFGKQRMD